jgi:hypothetical protein
MSTARKRHLALQAAIIGLLMLPVNAMSQDALPWEKPWDKTESASRAARAPNAAPPAAPSRLGADDPDAPPPASYGSGGYGSAQTYGTSPGYGSPGGNSGAGGHGGSAPAPYSTSQGYGSSPSYGSSGADSGPAYSPPAQGGYTPAPQSQGYGSPPGRGSDAYQAPRSSGGTTSGYGAPYGAPQGYEAPRTYEAEPDYDDRAPRAERRYDQASPRYGDEPTPGRGSGGGYYSQNEISTAGHGFFGSLTRGMASAIEHTFKKSGRPNGYILGEDGGGAFIAGLRYGEGQLFTKDAGQHRIYWQGPSLGYDVGAEGSKTMVLVYNMRDVQDLFNRFGGVEGSAYLIGGVSVQFQKYGDVTLALIRSGVGLRLGANVGYLKYSPRPTWNPF